MIVDCSDSRVTEGAIFDADPGTMFTAGNIANMFEEGDVSSNAVLTKVKHVVITRGHHASDPTLFPRRFPSAFPNGFHPSIVDSLSISSPLCSPILTQ
ncbi:hypothetical protein DFP72DRAFT_459711 [Ephemerocybe angulata]|uniref:Carbonic anhydrase n=1 Tax=Ephemerocybe angulata TaxID=980116 RepID=A0A8H6HSF0_9AGAR|nr:hypothetical protein DFP72DRAFT_459711 [Tulosesus angulatus]